MPLTVTHKFHSAKPDSIDLTLVNPSNWNDTHTVVGGSDYKVHNAQDFNFTAQQPGSNLAVGLSSFVMNPLPPGVLAGDSLYISGGSGAVEVVTVNSVVGNTVTIICANNHTGGWSVSSATSGIQEAELFRKANGGIVYMPSGSYPILTAINYYDQAYFEGQGESTVIVPNINSATIFLNLNSKAGTGGAPGGITSNGITFTSFMIDGSAFLTNTIYGIKMRLQQNTWTQSIANVVIREVSFNNIRYAVYGERTYFVTVTDCAFYLNSAIVFTDPQGDPNFRTFNTDILNLSFNYTLADGTGTLNLSDYFITLDKCVSTLVDNVTISGTGTAGGIIVKHASEGTVISNFVVEMFGPSGNPFFGIYLQETTHDTIRASPSTTQISNTVIDMVSTTGIVWEASTFNATDLKITNSLVTANPVVGGQVGITINGITLSWICICNCAVVGSFSNACIWLAQKPNSVIIHGNNLSNSHASGSCLHNDGAVDNVIVVANTSKATSGTALQETYGVPVSRFYWANTGETPIANYMRSGLTWANYKYDASGNAANRYYNGIDSGVDYCGFTHNYNRTSASTGTVDNTTFGTAEIQYYGIFSNFGVVKLRSGYINQAPVDILVASGVGITETAPVNYIATETGANNAIVGSITNITGTFANGLVVRVKLAHSLQAGVNTFNLNSAGAFPILSSRTLGNITSAYAVGGYVSLLHDTSKWFDLSQ